MKRDPGRGGQDNFVNGKKMKSNSASRETSGWLWLFRVTQCKYNLYFAKIDIV